MTLVSITANDIDIAGLGLDRELPQDWLDRQLEDAELKSSAPGHIEARLSRSGTDIIVRGRVSADLRTPCARCLEPADIHVDTELSLLLQPAAEVGHPHAHPSAAAKKNGKTAPKATKEPEYEFSSEEAELDTYDGETVVLDPFIREAILLEIPNFPLCSEACPGIRAAAPESPEEQAPERVDPRLAPLGALGAKLAAKKRPSKPPSTASVSKKKKNKE